MRPYWILWLVAAVLAVFGLYFLATWDALKPHSVTVQGNKLVGTEAIVARAGVDMHRNMWLQNANAIQTRIEAIPYIDLARVHRYLPNNVVIEVTERTPVAIVRAKNGAVLVDQRLRVLEPAVAVSKLPEFEMPGLDAPKVGEFFANDDLTNLRNDADKIEESKIDAVSYSHDQYGDLVVKLAGGVTVLFGDKADLEKKIGLVDPILLQTAKAKRPLATIDLRAPTAPIVIYKK